MVDVYYNEKFVGEVKEGQEFIKKFIEERRNSRLPKELNINYDTDFKCVYINASKGRARRPLIVVENGKSKLTDQLLKKLEDREIEWDDLIKQGVVEYIDADEEENCYVALSESELGPEYTHLEISPITILGITTSLVPYAHYGQSSRLNRGTKTQKQALGLYSSSYPLRLDTDISLLHYPQKPIVRSIMYDIGNLEKHPAGQNVTIAVMSFKGYNMQDSFIINKGSLDRGMGRSTYFRPYSAQELRYAGGLADEIGIPDKEVKGYKSEEDYKFLEDDGVIYPEAVLKEDNIMIGRTSPPRFLDDVEEFSMAANVRRESSVSVNHGESGIVDMVFITENEEGNKLVQVRLRDQRIPEVGDKFASRYGQKGVIGTLVNEQDMPFTASGITPDLIFSPHSIPSRMTVSHLIEILAGKAGALAGRPIDGTVFESEKPNDLKKMLLELGFKEDCTETMYNGITGEQYRAKIYIGNMFYMRLKHMVANKLHVRSSGRIELLTRQPIEGRSKGGGLRLGEMEKDCLIAHGASLLLKERFDSDKTEISICNNCGNVTVYSGENKKEICLKCGSNVEVSVIEMSYAFKLLLDELKAMCINPSIRLKSKF